MINRDVRIDYVGRDRTSAATRNATRNLDQIQGRLTRLSRTAANTQRVLAAATLGFAGNNAVRTLGDLQDGLTRVRNLSNNYARDQEFLSRSTKKLNLDLQGAVENYSQLLVLQNTGLIGSNQARDLFTGMQEAAARFGTSAGDIDLAIRGIRQALTQGTLRAQEFDQVFDAIGAAQPAVARQLGITTKQFQQLRASNSLAADTFVNALIPALLEYEGSAAKASKNINASLRRMSTSYKEALLDLEQPISSGINEFTDGGIAAIEALIEHSDKIKVVGATIAAVYGARALSSVRLFNGESYRAISIAQQHSQALVVNNKLISEKAAQTLAVAKAEQASLVAQNKSLNALKAQAATRQASAAIEARLTKNRVALATASNALVAANTKASAATTALTAAQRANTASAIAMAGASRTLSGALTLVGGPTGAAILAIGSLALAFRSANEDIRNLKRGVNDLNTEYRKFGEAAISDILEKEKALRNEILDIEAKQEKLLKRKDGSLRAEGDLQGRLAAQYSILNDQIERRNDLLRESASARGILTQANEFVSANKQVKASILELNTAARSSQDITPFVTKYLKGSVKLAVLRADLEKINDIADDSGKKAEIIEQIKKQIAAIEGAGKGQEEYTRKVERSKTALKQLTDSLQSEKERITQTFNNAEATIRLNVELNNLEGDQAITVLAKARERMEQQLADIQIREVETQRQAQEEKARLQADELARLQDHTQRMIAARSVINPAGGELERFKFEIDALSAERDKGLVSQQDYYHLAQAAYRSHVDAMSQIAESQVSNERTKFTELTKVQQAQLVGQQANAFLQAAQKTVGQYIELNESMTDSERKAASRQNAINAKKFRDNQRYQLGQVAVNTGAAVMRAYANYDFFTASGIAAALAATGALQARNIRSGSFGGSSVSTGGASSSGSDTNQTTIDTAQSAAPTANVVVLGMNPFLNKAQQREQILSHIDEAVEGGQLAIDKDSVGQVRELVVNL